MFDIIRGTDFRGLAEARGQYCVSLYLPTHRLGPDVAQDRVRLKNLVAQAAHELATLGVRPKDVADLLAGTEGLRDDSIWWSHLDRGLAVLARPGETRWFRLHEPVDELAVVADRFHLGPLAASVVSADGFYVLALSENQVRLLRGTRAGLSDVGLAKVPASLAEALRLDDRERQLQSHSANRVGLGSVTATFHGQGVSRDFDEVDRTRFLRAVDEGVAEILGPSSAPLVVAGVDDIAARFRSLSGYRHVVESGISGNPEHLDDSELHECAWALVAPRFDAERTDTLERLRSGSSPIATTLDGVVSAASVGRVEALFVAAGRHSWGAFPRDGEPVEGHAQRDPGDRDLCDQAGVDTLLDGGRVFPAEPSELPGDGPLAAVLRY